MSKTSVFNSPSFREIADGHVIGARHRINGVDPGAQEADAVFVLGPPVILLEVLAVGPHVHEENGGVQRIVFAMLLGDDRLLDGIHAADRGTEAVVAVIQVPGTDALEPGDLQGLLVVRGPHQVAGKGSGGGENPLKLHAGHHVGEMGVMIGPVLLGIEGRKARRQDDRAHLQLQLFRSQLVGHRLGLAGRGALHALGADAAIDAAGRFFHGLLFFIAQVDFLKTLDPLLHRHGGHEGPVLLLGIRRNRVPMAFCHGDGPHRQVPAGLQVLAGKKAVDGGGRFPARGHGRDGDPGTGLDVAAGKDALAGGGLGDRIGLDEAPGGQLDAVGLGDELQVGLLADGHDDHVGFPGVGFIVKIGGREPALLVEDPFHRPEGKAGDLAAGGVDLFDAPAGDDGNALVLGLFHFPGGGGHLFPGFQADEGDVTPLAPGGAGHIHGHVAAADDQHLFLAEVELLA